MADEIYASFLASSQNLEARIATVNALRHLLMDEIKVNTKDDVDYMLVYERVMGDIASQYPPLGEEVKRQIAKKKRRQERRSLEEQKHLVHI